MRGGRARSPNREKAFAIWRAAKGKISIREIAEKLGVSRSLVSRWKAEDNWAGNVTKDFRRKKRNTPGKKYKGQGNHVPKKNPLVKVVEKNSALNESQKKFCLFWLENHNATQAYLRAYQCSYDAARASASQLLANPNIREEITRLRNLQEAELMIDQRDIVVRYMHIAFADIKDFVEIKTRTTKRGAHQYVAVIPTEMVDGGIISQIKETKYGIDVKLADRMQALKWLADYFGANPRDAHKAAYDRAILELKERELTLKEDDW